LKEFQVLGDRLEHPKPKVVISELNVEQHSNVKTYSKKESELIIFGESSDKIQYALPNAVTQFQEMMFLDL
jgi:GTP pyrophosphokinase